jgi:hypothetical protein
MANAPQLLQSLHEPLSLASRHLADAAAPLASGSIPAIGIPTGASPPVEFAKLSDPAAPVAQLLSSSAAPIAFAAAPIAQAVPVLARDAPV